jgi:hypothetical protein
VLEGEVAEQRLRERLGLLGAGLRKGDDATEGRGEDVGDATQTPQLLRDGVAALLRVRGVLGELPTDRLGARLGDADLRDLGFRLRQLQQDAQLGSELAGVGDSDS